MTIAARSEVPLDSERLDAAIERAVAWLLSRQREDGSWNVVADMGPSCTAQVCVALGWAGVLREDEKTDIARWLRARQGADGGFVPYPYARSGSVAATAIAWAALTVCGAEPDDPAVVRARAFIAEHGGLEQLTRALRRGELAVLYLALAGIVPASRLPRLPVRWALVEPLTDALTHVVHAGVPFGALQLGLISRALRGKPAGDRRICDKLRTWIDLWQNRDGSINANSLQTAITLVALRAMGEQTGDRRFDLAVASLRGLAQRDEHGMWFGAFESDVWTTALSVRSLLSAGLDPRDERIVRAIGYLVRCQSDTPQPRCNNRAPGAVRTGGWAFQRDNVTMVDNDDTGMVLSVLGAWLELDRRDDLVHWSVERAVTRGRAFLTSMQNEDGGFSAFVRGLPRRRAGRTPGPLGDPSTEDVTARALLGLARTGSQRADRPVQAALAFLRRFQQPSGAWWGRWVVNYVPSTAYVISACAAFGLDRDSLWIESALTWLRTRQHADGGWGDWIDSYIDPARAGMAPSTPPLTGLVLRAMLDIGLAADPACERAARYLVDTQLPSGSWPNTDYLAVFVPPDSFYEYPGTNDYAPLDALARYRALRRSSVTSAGPHVAQRGLESRFAELSECGDPLADEAAAALDADDQWRAVFAALGTGRALPEVAAPVRALVAHTSRLPRWADQKQLLAGQRFFARHSWAMGNAFFFASIPASYAVVKGARVLAQSGRLATDARRRLLDTGAFMWTVMTPGSFDPDGAAYREVLRVRLVHARIRRTLIERGWPAREGNPIDQASMLGTTLVLSLVALRGLERLGVLATDDDAEALLHAWRIIGALIGVEEELLPSSMAEANACIHTLARLTLGRSEEGACLARELVRSVQAYVPGRALDDWPVDMIRHAGGDELADLLQLPPGGRTRPLISRTAELLRHDGHRLSPMDGFVHGATRSVIHVQRLPTVFSRALQYAFAAT